MSSLSSGVAIEAIPDEDKVSRAIFDAPDNVISDLFVFTYDSVRDERAESVYWRRYAPTIEDVHTRGCRLETKFRSAGRATALRTYIGARSAHVAALRSVRSQRGHELAVVHVPQDGDLAHAHIAISPNGCRVKKIKQNDKVELAELALRCFGDLERYRCA